MIAFAWVCLAYAAIPALLYLWNSFLFREPPIASRKLNSQPSISVLIPARNEEQSIGPCLEAVLASADVDFEVIVLDDHSTDRTAEVVRSMSERDPRVKLVSAPPLPDGWCGKQHACYVLSKQARFEMFTFLDADVRLKPQALTRMLEFLHQSRAALVSGFPKQETGTVLEKLLIPLINWLLLCFLPLSSMRRRCWASFGAGCGQWFMTTRRAYEQVGGHSVVKSSLHDGLMLPRAYRRMGLMTDLCDASQLATCRMYRSAQAVWFGLAKNAREGMASTVQIWFWTVTLLCGQVLPLGLFGIAVASGSDVWPLFGLAFLMSFVARLRLAMRFDRSYLGCILHPIAILLLLAVQWYAIGRAILGKPVGWKGRVNPVVNLTHPDLPRSSGQPCP